MRSLAAIWRRTETDSAERDSAAMCGRRWLAAADEAAAASALEHIADVDPGYADAVAHRHKKLDG